MGSEMCIRDSSLTLATVRVSSYPKPYGPPQPYYRARVTTPNPSVGGAGKGQRSHRTWEEQCFLTHPHRDRPHPHSICYGLEKFLLRFMTAAHSHTRTQRPQMTSGRVIWSLFFLNDHTLSRKKMPQKSVAPHLSFGMILWPASTQPTS